MLKQHKHLCLGRFQPNDEEKEMYKNYKEDKSKLQNADKFLIKVHHFNFTSHNIMECMLQWQLCDVPMLSKRLDLLFTIREFPANFEGFQPVGSPYIKVSMLPHNIVLI